MISSCDPLNITVFLVSQRFAVNAAPPELCLCMCCEFELLIIYYNIILECNIHQPSFQVCNENGLWIPWQQKRSLLEVYRGKTTKRSNTWDKTNLTTLHVKSMKRETKDNTKSVADNRVLWFFLAKTVLCWNFLV